MLARFKFRWLCKKCKKERKKTTTLCSLEGFLQVCNTLALIPMESTSSIIPLFSSLQTKPVVSWLLVCSICSTMCVQITRLILSSLRGTVRVKLQSYPHTVMWPPTNQPSLFLQLQRKHSVYEMHNMTVTMERWRSSSWNLRHNWGFSALYSVPVIQT